MIISISYYLGESQEIKYFNNYDESIIFIRKLEEVNNSDFLHFDFYVYNGQEEIRIRKLLSAKGDKP